MEDFSPSEAYCLFLSQPVKKGRDWGERWIRQIKRSIWFKKLNEKMAFLPPIIYMQLILNIFIPVRCALIIKENTFK